VAGFSIQTAGVILIVAGLVGLIASFFLVTMRRDRVREEEVVPVVPERRY